MSERDPAVGAVLIIGGVLVFCQTVFGGAVQRFASYSEDAPIGGVIGGVGGRGAVYATGAYRGAELVNVLQRQLGADYEWGEESPGRGFDCSGFIHWGMGKLGVPAFPRTSSTIIAHCKKITVARALRTVGGVLWTPGHIAVSMGNARNSIEARGEAYDVGKFKAIGRFQAGGLIPELMGRPADLPRRTGVPS